jgi:hypothetical protein
MTGSNNDLFNKPIAESRVIFLDNLRYLFVFGVVLQHACSAYIPMSESYNLSWWPVADNGHPFAGWLLAFLDAFLMPSLFFIAGYFAIPSIVKHGIISFIKGKLRRLGIPWLVCILFICPVLPFIYHLTRDGLKISRGYLDVWLAVMKEAIEFNFGVLPSMNQIMQNDLFYQRYMWFIGLLLNFFLIFCLFYRFKKSWFEPIQKITTSDPLPPISTLKILVFVGIFTFTGSSILIFLTFFFTDAANPEPWLTLGNVVQFRISRIFLHGTYFTLGILAYKRKWIERGGFPGQSKTLLLGFIVILIAFYMFRDLMMNGPESMTEIIMGGFWLCLNFLTISSLCLFISLASRYWNKPTTIDRNLAANSYYIYLSHYPYVFLFQLILFTLPGISPLMKFIFVSVLSIFFSYITCQYLIRPYPRLTIAATIALFLIMAVGIRA